uniref:Cytochrome P450 n=1 Tax=Salix viminalis TaxID=40686 RepID=A0A6N2MSB1_SALVM
MGILFTIFTFTATVLLLIIIAFLYLTFQIYSGKSIKNPDYPPVNGTIFSRIFYFNRLYDYQTDVAKKQKTFRLLGPGQSELYTTDIRNIEHVLKTKFDNYTKGKYNQDIATDLFGNGIFAVDGDKWRQQRKLASFEFSTRILRDFSCSVFRRNAAKLVRVISEMAIVDQIFDMQAFDDSNALVFWRYVDPLWKLKKYFNIGSEASLKKNIKIIDAFVTNLIRTKRKLLAEERLCDDKEDILSRFLVESKKDPEEMNDKYLRDIILNFMIAGKDTSANTLSWFFYMLCKNPVIQEKVAQEVRDVTRSQDDVVNVEEFTANITDTALEQMHYLHAALTETLRLYPAVPLNPNYPPVNGTIFSQLFYFNRLYDYQTEVARKQKTFRLLAPGQSDLYTTDIRNIEHVLKTNFDNYTKGKYNQDIVIDLFGNGIFAVDGDKWRQQRKLASFEFSTRVLRDFSCSVFRRNAAKLVRVISEMAIVDQIFDMQDTLMRCTLDSIFKVGFGVELNCLEGSSKEGTEFMKAFDDSNALVYWRYVDPLWKLKRYFNIGSEASLKKNIKIIDAFVTNLIRTKRKLLAEERLCNDKEDILSRFLVESKKDPEEMNDKYLRDIILNFMIAGKDTSANTLSWFFYMLCKNPLAQEVRDVTSSQDDVVNVEEFIANITDTALEQMHYLHAALTETLRLYPAVPVDGRCAEVDDILPDGYRMKKGDGLYYMAYAWQMLTFGRGCRGFRPERWLNNGFSSLNRHSSS